MRKAKPVVLSSTDDHRLRILSKRKRVEARVAERARIILLAAKGQTNLEIGATLKVDRRVAARWRQRYLAQGVDGLLKDAPRPGRPRTASAQREAEAVRVTLHEKPENATHWSVRTLGRRLGMSRSRVQRIWQHHGLKPHLVKTFKLSKDPRCVEKLQDIVGLYLNPPDRALVLSCDEKSQIQALNRTQPGLPLKQGRVATMTHDYKRHGTTTLFAALSVLDGKLIGLCQPRHRHQEWLEFLRRIDQETPPDLDLHLIVDNDSTHKHEKVKRWLARHPRFHVHFTPTGSSWLNMVERFFRDLSENRLKRASFTSV
ncbi:MAG: IS630 family transposase, partial [Xanthomonadaceae bacterium]|nr:IS630 family transposase [Xanthomonadaceae bacterium]